MPDVRMRRQSTLSIDGQEFSVELIEIPFREGVELSCEIEGVRIQVSDRGLGEHEAFRLLEDAIREHLLTSSDVAGGHDVPRG